MSFKTKIIITLFLSLLALGLSSFLLLIFKNQSLTRLHHAFPFSPFLWGALFIFSLLLFLFLWFILRNFFQRYYLPSRLFPVLAVNFLPWAGFLLSPFLLRFYWSRQDLMTRLALLCLFILLAFLLLIFMTYERATGSFRRLLLSFLDKFGQLPLRRKLVILFFVAFIFYQAVTLILVYQGVTFSGDEPNYLLTTHSLLYDGDINLANNYAQQDYFSFYSKKEHPRLKLGIYGRYGRKGKDYIYPINLPGISVLMIPFYALSQVFSGKLLTFILKGSLSLWAVLFGLQVYLYSQQRWRREGLALGLWFLTSFTPPVLFYACHLYPEMPIAFFSLLIYRRLLSSRPLGMVETLGLGFLLAVYPWFGLKYNFIFWPLLLLSLLRLWRHFSPKTLTLLFLLFPLTSQVLFYLFVHHLYGTFSPIAVYEGVLNPESMRAFRQMVLEIPFLLRLESFLDYFLDQRDGLLLYSPFYLFALIGLGEIARRAKKTLAAIVFLGLPFLLNYSFFTHRQGYSPQARVLTPIIWLGIIALGEFLFFSQKRTLLHLFRLTGMVSLVYTFLLLTHPSFLYQPTTHEFTSRPGDLFVYLSNTHFFLPSLLPSFIKVNNTGYWPNYLWTGGLLLFIIISVLYRQEARWAWGLGRGSVILFLIMSIFLWVLFPRPALYPTKTINYSPQRSLGFYLFSLGKGVVAKEEGDFYLHLEKPYRFIFGSKQNLERIQLILGSETGDYEVSLQAFDLPLEKVRVTREKKVFELGLPPAYQLRHLFLYEITLRLNHLSSESMLLEPFLFQVIPLRR